VIPDKIPCTLTFADGLMLDVEAADEARQLTLRGAPGYFEIDPDDEPFIPPPLRFEIETAFGPLDCELRPGDDGLVTLEITTRFACLTDDAFAAALDAYREVYEVWELMLLEEPAEVFPPAAATPVSMAAIFA
jgi:hypothetical protein